MPKGSDKKVPVRTSCLYPKDQKKGHPRETDIFLDKHHSMSGKQQRKNFTAILTHTPNRKLDFHPQEAGCPNAPTRIISEKISRELGLSSLPTSNKLLPPYHSAAGADHMETIEFHLHLSVTRVLTTSPLRWYQKRPTRELELSPSQDSKEASSYHSITRDHMGD